MINLVSYGTTKGGLSMYQEMYLVLFNRITNIIEELEEIQRESEALYINASEGERIKNKAEAYKETGLRQ
ncbi:MAG: hypothetical protein E7234_09725 [Lachnospiraceae bacterium]|nr:hypothetical protein [Lachnospiraceae bacterium]